ncbi:hypothetical protein ACFWP2_34055 [Kitasatospora sp. NPDC058444]|uniref:hypothetical protein n=1 Tax=Kitasatospora sp. NPDC058444 TaxID=3346504 RepID=UPI003665B930
MIAIVASAVDDEAAALARRWARHDAAVITPLDLSRPGWQAEVGGGPGTFVAAGIPRPADELTGVLVRLPAVPPRELVGVVPEDRPYAASESTAMLSWWLGRLTCPVVNPPTPTCLVGPPRSRLEWLCHAARLGIPTASGRSDGSRSRAPRSAPAPRRHHDRALVTVIGGRARSGPAAPRPAAEALAADAGLPLLGAWFHTGSHALNAVTLVPPLTERAVLAALEETLS